MNFNKHLEVEGKHAFLSPSSYHWTNYTDEKLDERYLSMTAAAKGTALHAFANSAINLGVKISRSNKLLSLYVNDAIGYKMESEQPLYFSDNCFGTADTISFRRQVLRIHDLKTGLTPVSEKQLEVYAAIFCLEYGISPLDITMEFRIYQNDDVIIYDGVPDIIFHIMDKIVSFDRRIQLLKEGVLG